MKPWKTLATAKAPGGSLLTLQQRDFEFAIRVNGQMLISSRSTGSERALAKAACAARIPQRILVGGLGMGFTLRAVLDQVSLSSKVLVAELSQAVIDWNQGILGPLANQPLKDARVSVFACDVGKVYRQGPFDAIILDVDNGPTAIAAESNASLYQLDGLARARAALGPQGTFVVWSAGPDQHFIKRLQMAGFDATSQRVERHTLFIASTTP